MSKLTLDSTFRTKLAGVDEPLEFCDQMGHTVGHFLPGELYQEMIYKLAESKCPFPLEQLKKKRTETSGDTLAKVWQRVGQK